MPRIYTPVKIPETQPISQRISWWVENTLVRAFKRWLNDAAQSIRDILNLGVSDFVEDTENELISMVRPLANQLLSNPNTPEGIRNLLEQSLSGEHQAGILALAGIAVAAGTAIASGIAAPVAREVEYAADSLMRSRLLDPSTLTVLNIRGIIDNPTYQARMAQNGLSNDAIAALEKLAHPLFDESTLARLYHLGELSREYVTDSLNKRGFTAQQISVWFEAIKLYPSVSDLVSMSVREAYNDSVAAKFGYDADYPEDAAIDAEKQGLDSVWFKRFWRAHWTLPGLTQVREMYNREIIDDTTLNEYLRAADIPPFWRKSIGKWMRAEVTRVDLRRIFSLGLLTNQELYQRYRKLGYTEDDSALLVEWTIAEYLDEERQLTKTDILSMYESGILNENEASTYLEALDFSDSNIALLLAHTDLKRQEAYEKQIISNVKKLYIAGIYDRTDVFQYLGKIDTPANFIEQSLAVWDLEIENKVSIPTTAQLRDMTNAGIISRERFRVEMGNRGYTPEYISWYEALWLEE